MEILQIEPADLVHLAELYQQLIPNKISMSKMNIVYLKNKDNPNHIVLVAKKNGALVGTVLACICEMYFGQCKSFMVVEDVVVDMKHRGTGIGTALMQKIEEYAKHHNCSYIMLVTDSDRADSQEFYKSIGYNSSNYYAFKKKL